MSVDELLRLAERVEREGGSDMPLARGVMLALGWHRVTPSQCGCKHGGFIAPEDWIGATSGGSPVLDGLHGTTIYRDVPDVTSSLDAVEALRQRLLPGSFLIVQHETPTQWRVALHMEGVRWEQVTAPTEARARLAALLRAVAGKEA